MGKARVSPNKFANTVHFNKKYNTFGFFSSKSGYVIYFAISVWKIPHLRPVSYSEEKRGEEDGTFLWMSKGEVTSPSSSSLLHSERKEKEILFLRRPSISRQGKERKRRRRRRRPIPFSLPIDRQIPPLLAFQWLHNNSNPAKKLFRGSLFFSSLAHLTQSTLVSSRRKK